MAKTFYFYDLETSGVKPQSARIMQFAGQRTSLTLDPIGEPDNILIKLSNDVLPDPDAILITGITPQSTLLEGVTEAEFLRYFYDNIATADTIFVGFNNVRFDDEFMRYLNYRNFYDAYEWCWKDGRSRWDVLDLVRMTRALRPDGIKWPFATDGKPSNALGLLTSINGLTHENAHDALSDVLATINVARLIRNKQTKLFDYLLSMRDKNEVKKLANSGRPFVYTSGKYPSLYDKTTVVAALGEHTGKQGVLVFDLRFDPNLLEDKSPEQLAKLWTERQEDETKRFPIKTLQFKRCPAVAPLSVLDGDTKTRLNIKDSEINNNLKSLGAMPNLYDNCVKALEILEKQRQTGMFSSEYDVDTQLYEGFFGDEDRNKMGVVRAADKTTISALDIEFNDDRLNKLLPLYKARNYPSVMSDEDRAMWEDLRRKKILGSKDSSPISKYFIRLNEIAGRKGVDSKTQYLLQELQLYGESILPESYGDSE